MGMIPCDSGQFRFVMYQALFLCTLLFSPVLCDDNVFALIVCPAPQSSSKGVVF